MSLIEAAERAADRLNLRQPQRLAPGDALGALRLALEAGLGVARHEKQIAEFACDARADA